MWLFSRYGFYAATKTDNGLIQVSSSSQEHLENLIKRFQDITGKVTILENHDYFPSYRIYLTHKIWSRICKRIVEEIDYVNFNQAIKNEDYRDMFKRIWEAVQNKQNG